MSIKHWPEGERPREKLLERGAGALSDAELLAVLLRVGTQGMSAVDMARSLLKQFGSLRGVMQADARELCRHKGMGTAAYAQFATVMEIGRRVLGEELQRQPVFHSPEAAAGFLRLRIGSEKVEVGAALFLNAAAELIACEEISPGSTSEHRVYISTVARRALHHHAAAVIFAHNHPSGSLTPSAEDLAFTRNLSDALALLEVRLLDHFIVSAQAVRSVYA